jgi:large subunit ribosomal protein L17
MRHRKKSVKLGRSQEHRKALVAALVCGLIERKRIRTTLSKARLARSMAERMVTLARKGTLAARRRAIGSLRREGLVRVLTDEIVPKIGTRAGGYTRIVKVGPRRADGAEMALLEWVDVAPPERKKRPKKAEKGPAEPK